MNKPIDVRKRRYKTTKNPKQLQPSAKRKKGHVKRLNALKKLAQERGQDGLLDSHTEQGGGTTMSYKGADPRPGGSSLLDDGTDSQPPMFEEVILKQSPHSSPAHSEHAYPLPSPTESLPQEPLPAALAPTRRVVNLEHFARELMALGAHPLHCRNGQFQLSLEISRDLESDLVYKCFMCGAVHTVSTDPVPGSVNGAFVSAGVSMGIAYSQLQEVLSAAELPAMSEASYKVKEAGVHMNFESAEFGDQTFVIKEEREEFY